MTGLTLRRGVSLKHKIIVASMGLLTLMVAPAYGLVSGYIAEAANILPAPTLISPVNGVVVRGDPLLVWQPYDASQVNYYIYESYYDAALTNKIFTANLTTTSRNITGWQTIHLWWRVIAVNKDGSRSTSQAQELYVDNTAPVGSLSDTATRTQSGYYSGAVSVTGRAAQEQNLATHQYQITNPDGTATNVGPVTATSNTHTFTLDTSHGDGSYVVKYTAIDKAGNVGTPVSMTVKYDNTPPTVPPVLTGDTIRYKQPGEVHRTWAKSAASDVATYYYKSFYSEDDAVNHPDTATARFTASAPAVSGQNDYDLVNNTGPEERTFWYRVAAVDAAGNKTWSQAVHRVTIDSTAPAAPALSVGSITSGGLTKDTGVTATWNVPSGDTASYEYRYRVDTDVDWQVSAVTDTQWAQALARDTTHHMQVRAIDLAGNASEWSPEFVLTRDATPPTVSVAAGAWSASTTQPVVVVTGETDAVAYLWHAPPEVQMTSETVAEPQFTVPTGVSGAYALTLTVTDAAGNQTTVPFDISYTYFVPVQRVDPVIPVQDTAPQPTQPSGQQLDSGAAASGSTSNVAYDDAVPASVQISPSVAVVQATRDIRAAGAAAAGKQDTDSRDPAPAAVGGEVSDQAGNGTRDVRAVKGTSTWNIFGFGVFWLGLVCALVLAIAGIWWLLVARRRARQSDRVPTED